MSDDDFIDGFDDDDGSRPCTECGATMGADEGHAPDDMQHGKCDECLGDFALPLIEKSR